ncbi:MAG: hypothetical protein CMA55_00405 [Euryarchaeota archaeon]|nr:hypothetical protein [Euryarchaeota archaeon]
MQKFVFHRNLNCHYNLGFAITVKTIPYRCSFFYSVNTCFSIRILRTLNQKINITVFGSKAKIHYSVMRGVFERLQHP